MNRRGTLVLVLFTILVFSTALVSQVQQTGRTNLLTQQVNEYEKLLSQKSQLDKSNEELKQGNESLKQEINSFEEEVEITEKQLKTAKEKELSLVQAKASVAMKPQAKTSNVNEGTTPTEAVTDWINFTATFYNAGTTSTGKKPGDKQYGITRSGRPVTPGVTVSVDPKVIPLGTWIEIKFPDGNIERRRADDTGNAVRGHKVDVFSPSSNSVLRELGIQKVQIRIVD